MSAKDFIGNELSIGDVVVFCAPRYRHLCKGVVLSISEQKLVVEYKNTWHYTPAATRTYQHNHNFFVKVTE